MVSQEGESVDEARISTMSSRTAEVDNQNPVDKEDACCCVVPEGCTLQSDGRILVDFERDDPQYPYNWPKSKRWVITGWAGVTLFNSTLASSAPSGAAEDFSEVFGVSLEASSLVLSLFLVGYCVGPFCMAPLSERFGRRVVLLGGSFVFTIFSAACAGAPNFGGLLTFRFLAGVFASGPLTNAGSCVGDMWEPAIRGEPLSVFSVAPFAGPAVGPLLGGYISSSSLSWRWLFGILAMMSAVITVLSYFLFPETYSPVILARRARKYRKQYKSKLYYAPLEEMSRGTFTQQASVIVVRPFTMLFTEPIVYLATLYLSIAYGLTYLLFEAYPIVYMEIRGMSAGPAGLAFLSILIGAIIACFVCLRYQSVYLNDVAKREGEYVPELRLKQGFLGGPLVVISMFWLGWTGYKANIHWAAPMASGIPMGIGCVLIFRAFQTYLIDAYGRYSASCLAATVVVRSIAGAGFPLFARAMYHKLGVEWASTLLACITLVICCPIPVLFYKYGEKIREKSRYAPSKKAPAKAIP